jgi:hypothetical protein
MNSNVLNVTGQHLSSIILAHIDLDLDYQMQKSIPNAMSFEFHPVTFQYLFSIIEQLTTDSSAISNPTIIYMLTICLRLFRIHLQYLQMISPSVNEHADTSIDINQYANEEQLQQWFTLLIRLINDHELEHATMYREISMAIVTIINHREIGYTLSIYSRK